MALAVAPRPARSADFGSRQADLARRNREKVEAKYPPLIARQLGEYFVGLSQRLEGTFTAGGLEVKAAGSAVSTVQLFNAHDWAAEDKKVYNILRQSYIKLSAQAYDDVHNLVANTRGAGNVGTATVAFDLNGRNMKQILGQLSKRVKDIGIETRWRLSRVIVNGTNEGLHPSVIAKNIVAKAAEGYLPDLSGISNTRAMTIARTETAHAYSWSSIAAYKESGIVKKVVCHDSPDCGWQGHNGAELANGTHRTLDEAQANPTSHPNCVRAFSPAFGDEPPGIRQRQQQPAKPGAKPTGAQQPPKADPWANPHDSLNASKEGRNYGYGQHPGEQWAHQITQKVGSKYIDPAGRVPTEYQRALQHYQGSGYTWMNQHLRGVQLTQRSEGLRQIDQLTELLDQGRTPTAVKVVRGTGSGRQLGFTGRMTQSEKEAYAQTLVGSIHTEQGFMSTAVDRAASFGGVELELTVPKGYPALPLSNSSTGFSSLTGPYATTMPEAELLLQQGAQYVVDKVEVVQTAYATPKIRIIGRVLPKP